MPSLVTGVRRSDLLMLGHGMCDVAMVVVCRASVDKVQFTLEFGNKLIIIHVTDSRALFMK